MQAVLLLRYAGAVRSIRVVGDRVWCQGQHGPVASRPTPFTEMSLGWDRAYGGAASIDGVALPHWQDPAGRGYALDPETWVGTALANLEDPRMPVSSPAQHPGPWCFDRLAGPTVFQSSGEWASMTAQDQEDVLLQRAHPALRFPRSRGGGEVEVAGFDRPWTVRLPPSPLGLLVAARAAAEPAFLQLELEGIHMDAGSRDVELTWSTFFTYAVHQHESRITRLVARRSS